MEKHKEYMVHIWGGAWNSDANPSIEKDLGIKNGYHYFKTEQEKNDFCKMLDIPKYANQGLMRDIKYGYMSHKRTIFVGKFIYQKKEFVLHYDFGYEYPEESAIFTFTEGNYSCDCNRSLFIREEYGDDAIPDLKCGDEIKLLGYHFEYFDWKDEVIGIKTWDSTVGDSGMRIDTPEILKLFFDDIEKIYKKYGLSIEEAMQVFL